MSSPRSIGGSAREGTRVVLREITASLHNSPQMQCPRRKIGNDTPLQKTTEHEVKVRFAREFADVGSVSYSSPESLSSASSYHSLTSTLSTKSSSGICVDSTPRSPNDVSNNSYVNSDIPGVEDLIAACAHIQIQVDECPSLSPLSSSHDISQDQTFASATDELASDLSTIVTEETEDLNITPVNEEDSTHSTLNRTRDNQEHPILRSISVEDNLSAVPYAINSSDNVQTTEVSTENVALLNKSNDIAYELKANIITNESKKNSLTDCTTGSSDFNSTVCLSPNKLTPDLNKSEGKVVIESDLPKEVSLNSSVSLSFNTLNSAPYLSEYIENVECPTLPSISTISSVTDDSGVKLNETYADYNTDTVKNVIPRSSSPVSGDNIGIPESTEESLEKSAAQEREESKGVSQLQVPNVSKSIDSEENLITELNEYAGILEETPYPQINLEPDSHIELQVADDINIDKFETSLESKSVENICAPNKSQDLLIAEECTSPKSSAAVTPEIVAKIDSPKIVKEERKEEEAEQSPEEKLDLTLTFQDTVCLESAPDIGQYTEFQPQRQSTTLALTNEQRCFDRVKSAVEYTDFQQSDDIVKSSLDFTDDDTQFISATSEIFQDPTTFDFFLARGNSMRTNRLRTESLYMKFDPLVSNSSMLSQESPQILNEEENSKKETPPPNLGTPKRNPAIAAIDRLLFYSPLPSGTITETEKREEKIEQPVDKSKSESPLIPDINMSRELELVRTTVLQLEEQLEKQKKEYEAELEKQKEEYEAEVEKQKVAFQERINELQLQISQEMKNGSQMALVMDEYEKSISRLHTEIERDRTNSEQEKTKLQEELQAANVHLTNTEAAFNDVHQKYERLKGVVSAYKSNETVLKESIQENMETIKGLEIRYDQLKNHAMAQLEKANFELDGIRKQHERETVKLRALVRKADLKSNSLAELVEQKTKENKELSQILDELIARVGHQNSE